MRIPRAVFVSKRSETVFAAIHTFMPTPSFHEWLATRPDEALAADRLATMIAQVGANGISRDELARALRFRSEALQEILGSLLATGQVVVFKVNGELRYRATT